MKKILGVLLVVIIIGGISACGSVWKEDSYHGMKYKIPKAWKCETKQLPLWIGNVAVYTLFDESEGCDFDFYIQVVEPHHIEADGIYKNLEALMKDELYMVKSGESATNIEESSILLDGISAQKIEYDFRDESTSPTCNRMVEVSLIKDGRYIHLWLDDLNDKNEALFNEVLDSIEFK